MTNLTTAEAAIATGQALAALHHQHRFSEVLETAVRAARAFGAPCYMGAFMRDGASEGWHLTALLDPSLRRATLEHLGLPLGPLACAVPNDLAPRPLAAFLGAAWGEDGCGALERRLGTSAAIFALVPGTTGPRAALFALLPDGALVEALAVVLEHAVAAAERCLDRAEAQSTDGVADPASFVERGNTELARAKRYDRPVSLVVYEFEAAADAIQAGAYMARRIRQFDVLGHMTFDGRTLAVLLPETTREGALGFIDRFAPELPRVPVGAAIVPEDGDELVTLMQAARARAVYHTGRQSDEGGQKRDERVWVRGAPAGPGTDTVRCPKCLTPFTRSNAELGRGADAQRVERARAMALEVLNRECPAHRTQLIVEGRASAAAAEQPRRGFAGMLGLRRS